MIRLVLACAAPPEPAAVVTEAVAPPLVATAPAGPTVRLAYNNAHAFGWTADGVRHDVWADRQRLVHRRVWPDGRQDERVLAEDVDKHAVVETDGARAVLILWASARGGLKAALSEDGGASFGAPASLTTAQVVAPGLRVWSGPCPGPGCGVRAVAVWHEGPETAAHVWAASFGPDGWGARTQLDRASGEARFPTAAGLGDTTEVLWRENAPERPKEWTLVRASWSGVGPWTEPVRVREGHDPSLCVSAGGELHLGFQDQKQAYYMRSGDHGATWSEPHRLGPGLFARPACDGTRHVAVVWEWIDPPPAGSGPPPVGKERNAAKTVGVARSSDGGQSFVIERPVDAFGLMFTTGAIGPDGRLVVHYVDAKSSTVHTLDFGWP